MKKLQSKKIAKEKIQSYLKGKKLPTSSMQRGRSGLGPMYSGIDKSNKTYSEVIGYLGNLAGEPTASEKRHIKYIVDTFLKLHTNAQRNEIMRRLSDMGVIFTNSGRFSVKSLNNADVLEKMRKFTPQFQGMFKQLKQEAKQREAEKQKINDELEEYGVDADTYENIIDELLKRGLLWYHSQESFDITKGANPNNIRDIVAMNANNSNFWDALGVPYTRDKTGKITALTRQPKGTEGFSVK